MTTRRATTRSFPVAVVTALLAQLVIVPPLAQVLAASRQTSAPTSIQLASAPAPQVDPATGLKTSATEIVSARTEYSQTFDNHDGTRTTQFFAHPAFYQPSGATTLQPISVGFAATPGGYASTQAPATVAVAAVAQGHNFLTTSYNGMTIGFAPAASQLLPTPIAPVASGPVANYANFMPGVGLRVIATASGAKSFFIWTAPPTTPSISYVVDAPGLTLTPQSDGSISFVNGAGATVAKIPTPYAVDSTSDARFGSGHTTSGVSLSLGSDGRTVTVSVDPTWLKTAVYPVFVDPSSGWIYNAGSNTYGDAFVDSHSGNGYADYVDATTGYHELWNGTSPADSGVTYDFLRWDLSAYANVTVDSATLRLYPWHQYYNAPTSETTYVRQVTSSWTESGVTWANKPSYTSTNMATTGCVESSYCSFDVANIAQLWLQGISPAANWGFQVDTIGKNDTYWKRFFSSEQGGSNRPAFQVTYHNAVATAAYPTGGGPSPSTTVSWTYSDAGSAAQTKYHVDFATDAAFTQNLQTSGDVSSAAKSWPVPTALTPGTTYYWRVKAYNGTSWSAFSSTASFVYDLANLGLQPQFKTETFDLGAGDQAAVNVSTGDLVLSHPIVTLPIRGSSVAIGLTYNSEDPANVGMGPGWRLSQHRRLTLNGDGTVTFIDGDGARNVFTSPVTNGTVTTYTRPAALFATLVKDTSQSVEFTLTYRDQSIDTFDVLGAEGLLTRSQDRFGNGVTTSYISGTNRISAVTDTAASPNRTIDFAYDGSNRLTSITDWAYVDGSGIVQTTVTGSRRVTRFFYDGSGNLAGWADPLNTAGSCPTGGSHLTCLTYGTTMAINKTQTVEATGATALTTSTRTITTQISFVGAEVASVKDAQQVAVSGPATTFTRGVSQMAVVRPGTPASTTTYGYVAATDPYGRVQSVWRLLNGTNIEQRTLYDPSFPTLASSVIDNYVDGAPNDAAPAEDHITGYTYVAGSLGLVARLTEPLTAATHRTTDYTYNAHNDVTQKTVALDGSGSVRTITRDCYDASCTLAGNGLTLLRTISNYVDGIAGNGSPDAEDVTTTNTYDAFGQLNSEARANYNHAGTLLDARVTGHTYDDKGDLLSDIANYADGAVNNSGDDITPNATTHARTDLTTTYGYDTAGNRVSTADPRRAIEAAKGTTLTADDFIGRLTFDALGESLSSTLPTTPTSMGGLACSPDPGCRRRTSTYDELGGIREQTTYAPSSGTALQAGVEFDRDGESTRTFEDADGVGAAQAPAVTSIATYDAAGRVLTSQDRRQAADTADLGETKTTYDSLGRSTQVVEGFDVISGDGITPATGTTTTGYDALDRTTSQTTGTGGSAQMTTTGFDIGGRTLTTDDEFTCTSQAFDYRDLATQVVEGLVSPGCTGSGTRIVNDTYDGLGRLASSTDATNNVVLSASQYDSFGSILISQKTDNATTISENDVFTTSLLDQVVAEHRYTYNAGTGITSNEVWNATNFDAAGNATDQCSWSASPSEACKPADQSFVNPQPTNASTTTYDARSQRIGLVLKLGSASVVATTTYDPTNDYQTLAHYLPTASGKEAQDLYTYDVRHRLATITHQLCVISTGHLCNTTTPIGSSSYGYDDNNNRTAVTESSDGGTPANRNYCYDAVNRLRAEKAVTACTLTSGDDTYTYDDPGNRLTSTVSGVTRTFTYNGMGQLSTCANPTCSISYDADGRTKTITDNGTSWTFLYDADGRLVSACGGTTCSGSGFNRVDYTYDGSGHRTQIVETTSAGAVTTTTFQYSGDAITSETVNGVLTRTYAVDDAGRIVEACDPDCGSGTVYVVVYNGHADVTGLWKKNADGTLTRANTYTYSSWGVPTTTIGAGFSDLKFRFLYVGGSDVQWDNSFGLALLYMHARHYSPAIGRFLQPDPARADGALYSYAGNSPVTVADPSGHCGFLLALEWAGPVAWFATGVCVFGVAALGYWALHNTFSYVYDHWQGESPTYQQPPLNWSNCYQTYHAYGCIALAQRDRKQLDGLRRARNDLEDQLERRRLTDPWAVNHWERKLRGIIGEIEDLLRRHPNWRLPGE